MPRLRKIDISGYNVGEIIPVTHGNLPACSLWCDGSLLLVSLYYDLFLKIGNTFGGDGIVNFRLPDKRSRMGLGAGLGSGLTSRTVGATHGAESVSLDITHFPSHYHGAVGASTSQDGQHNHTYTEIFNLQFGDQSSPFTNSPVRSFTANTNMGSDGNHTHSITSTNGGAGTTITDNNMSPFFVCNFAIAYK